MAEVVVTTEGPEVWTRDLGRAVRLSLRETVDMPPTGLHQFEVTWTWFEHRATWYRSDRRMVPWPSSA